MLTILLLCSSFCKMSDNRTSIELVCEDFSDVNVVGADGNTEKGYFYDKDCLSLFV